MENNADIKRQYEILNMEACHIRHGRCGGHVCRPDSSALSLRDRLIIQNSYRATINSLQTEWETEADIRDAEVREFFARKRSLDEPPSATRSVFHEEIKAPQVRNPDDGLAEDEDGKDEEQSESEDIWEQAGKWEGEEKREGSK